MSKLEIGLSIGALAGMAGLLSGCEDDVSVRIPTCYDPDPFVQVHALRTYQNGFNKRLYVGEVSYIKDRETGGLVKRENNEEILLDPNSSDVFSELINGRTVSIQFEQLPKSILATVTAICE